MVGWGGMGDGWEGERGKGRGKRERGGGKGGRNDLSDLVIHLSRMVEVHSSCYVLLSFMSCPEIPP